MTERPAKRLNGRIAVVTGGAQGIGFGIARRLAEEGAHVVIADIKDAAAKGAATSARQPSAAASASRSGATRRTSCHRLRPRRVLRREARSGRRTSVPRRRRRRARRLGRPRQCRNVILRR